MIKYSTNSFDEHNSGLVLTGKKDERIQVF